MTKRILCLGIATLDRIWHIDEWPVMQGKYKAHQYREQGGGMAATAAVTIARLGGQVYLVSRVGEDAAAKQIIRELDDYQVDVHFIKKFADRQSTTSAVVVDQAGERTVFSYSDVNMPVDTQWLDVIDLASFEVVLADIRWWQGAAHIFAKASQLGIPTILDGEKSSLEAYAAVLPHTTFAIFSEGGLCSLLNKEQFTLSSPEERTAGLVHALNWGAQMAMVTLGRHGGYYLQASSPTLVEHCPALDVDVVDTNGAGDVFHGAFALAIAEGQSLADATIFASAAAALKCTMPGGRLGIPTRVHLNDFLTSKHLRSL